MANAILTNDKGGVITVFTMHDEPCFSIWERSGKSPLFSCTEESEEDRKKVLNESLDFIFNSGSTAAYEIRFHEQPGSGKKINTNTPAIGSLPFRLNQEQSLSTTKGGDANNISLLRELFSEKMSRFEDKYERLLEDKESEIEELQRQLADGGQDDEEDMGKIGSIFKLGDKYPAFGKLLDKLSDAAGDLIIVGKHKLKGGVGGDTATHLAGTGTPDERLKQALKLLVEYHVAHYGTGDNEEQKYNSGYVACIENIERLAKCTTDEDLMEMMLNKLKKLD